MAAVPGAVRNICGETRTSERVVQDALWDDVLLHVARLTDPPKSGKGARFTTRRAVKSYGDVQGLDGMVDTAVVAAEFVRDPRNLRISHLNLEVWPRR
jgi:hypothetical protein